MEHGDQRLGSGPVRPPAELAAEMQGPGEEEKRAERAARDEAAISHHPKGEGDGAAKNAIMARGFQEHYGLDARAVQFFRTHETADEDRLGDAIALEGVARYPVRVKCALLGWMAAKDAIQTYQADGADGANGGGEEA